MATDYRKIARADAVKYGIDPTFFERQIDAESGFQLLGANSAGAIGIAQITGPTAKAWGVNPSDPIAALDAAARHMAGYIKKYGGWEPALRAYNAGEGAVQASHGYAETNAYVAKILRGQKDPGTLAPATNLDDAKAGTAAAAGASSTPDRGFGTGLLAPILNVIPKALLYIALIVGGAILIGLGARRAATGQQAAA